MFQPAKTDDLQRKLAPPSSRGCWTQCCSLQTVKRVGGLLAFHLLNVFVAVGGAISVVFMLTSMALMPIWVLIKSVDEAIQRIEKMWLVSFCYAVLAALFVFLQAFLPVGLTLVIVAGALSVRIFFRCGYAMKTLVKIDVKLASFVTTGDFNAHDPDDCQSRFGFPGLRFDGSFLERIRMPRCMWLAVIYFATIKIVCGVLSVAVLFISLVLPALEFSSGGEVSLFADQFTFSDNPITYTVLVITVWLVGVVGVSVVAVLSVKGTFWVCDAALQQLEVVAPVTPSSELTTTNFVQIDPSTSAGA